MNDTDFVPEVQTQAPEGQGQVQTVQPQPEAAPEALALSFLSATPQGQPPPEQSGGDSKGITQFRPHMHVVPADEAVIAYVNSHNRQNPNNPITLADASKEVRFGARESQQPAPIYQAQPPTDFAARITETQQAQQQTETELAAASEAQDHQRVAQLMLHAARLEADVRDIRRDEQAWQQHAQQSQREAQAAALSNEQSVVYADLIRQFPDLGIPGSPLRARFEQEWQAAGRSNDSTLRSGRAPESILGRVIVQMGGIPQAQPPQPQYRQPQTWPVIPGTASPTAMRNAPAFPSETEIATRMRNGDYTPEQLDAILNARRA